MPYQFKCPVCQKDCETDGDKSKYLYSLEEDSISHECIDKALNKLDININDIKNLTRRSDALAIMLFKLILNQ